MTSLDYGNSRVLHSADTCNQANLCDTSSKKPFEAEVSQERKLVKRHFNVL